MRLKIKRRFVDVDEPATLVHYNSKLSPIVIKQINKLQIIILYNPDFGPSSGAILNINE